MGIKILLLMFVFVATLQTVENPAIGSQQTTSADLDRMKHLEEDNRQKGKEIEALKEELRIKEMITCRCRTEQGVVCNLTTIEMCPHLFSCPAKDGSNFGEPKCLLKNKICDGINDCKDDVDEASCVSDDINPKTENEPYKKPFIVAAVDYGTRIAFAALFIGLCCILRTKKPTYLYGKLSFVLKLEQDPALEMQFQPPPNSGSQENLPAINTTLEMQFQPPPNSDSQGCHNYINPALEMQFQPSPNSGSQGSHPAISATKKTPGLQRVKHDHQGRSQGSLPEPDIYNDEESPLMLDITTAVDKGPTPETQSQVSPIPDLQGIHSSIGPRAERQSQVSPIPDPEGIHSSIESTSSECLNITPSSTITCDEDETARVSDRP